MWKNYHEGKSPSKKVSILQAIVSMQPYLSGYYDATTYVLSKRLKTDVIGASKSEIGYLELKTNRNNEEEFDDEEHQKIRDLTRLIK